MSQQPTGSGVPARALLGAGVGIAAVGGAAYLLHRHLNRDVMPKKWRRVGRLRGVHLFPLKSGAPLRMEPNDEFECDKFGLRIRGVRDRCLMLIDTENQMVTARIYPRMLLIQPILMSEMGLEFEAPGMTNLSLDFEQLRRDPGPELNTSVWGVPLEVMQCGPRFDTWFSKFLLNQETGLRLVHYQYPIPNRPVTPRLANQPYITPDDSGIFGDATSFMLMNLASIDDLNDRLTRKVKAAQFRSNFDLEMDHKEPYAEDNWDWIRVGDSAVFRIVAPCTRCILPNIDTDSAVRDPDGEPLKTLRTYRLFDFSSPALGVHMGIREEGSVRLYDTVYVGVA